jgi:hypothetical protein
MLYSISEFARRVGFQVAYGTSDPDILAEFHAFFVACVVAGGFEQLMLGAKVSFIDFPSGQEHLRDHIVDIVAAA